MAVDNTNTANRPASYTIVFEVRLNVDDVLSYPRANENMTYTQIAQQRSTWIPSKQTGGGEQNRVYRHGDQFTAYDDEAYYLKANYLRSATNPKGVLIIISETL